MSSNTSLICSGHALPVVSEDSKAEVPASRMSFACTGRANVAQGKQLMKRLGAAVGRRRAQRGRRGPRRLSRLPCGRSRVRALCDDRQGGCIYMARQSESRDIHDGAWNQNRHARGSVVSTSANLLAKFGSLRHVKYAARKVVCSD